MGDLGIIFPGQGAQRPGMAQDFFDAFEVSKEVFRRASEALDIDMQELCFTENENLNKTEFTQPAILTAEISMLEAVKHEVGLEAKWFAGHSLGEYTALVAAHVVRFEDAVKIVRKRGALMQGAVPLGKGAMAALIADDLAETGYLEIVQSAGAEVANFNSSQQVVISGAKEAVESACLQIHDAIPSIRAVPLNVSAPFHCQMMKGIEEEFSEFLGIFSEKFALNRSQAVLSNYTGALHSAETLVDSLVSQISGSVRWLENMELLQGECEKIIEIGPSRVLAKFFGTIDVAVPSIINVRAMQKTFTK